jgi:hypothetical protein
MNEYYRVKIIYNNYSRVIKSSIFIYKDDLKPDSTIEHDLYNDIYISYFINSNDAENFRLETTNRIINESK